MDEDFLARLMASQDAPARRRRGGLAGVWDRNKQIVKPVVSGALGLVPGVGMGLAAGAGALMSGLDREGQGGVGFNARQGVGGAMSGLAAGGIANLGRSAVQGAGQLLGRGAAQQAVPQAAQQALPPVGQMADTGLQSQLAGRAGPAGLPSNFGASGLPGGAPVTPPLPPAGPMASTGLGGSVASARPAGIEQLRSTISGFTPEQQDTLMSYGMDVSGMENTRNSLRAGFRNSSAQLPQPTSPVLPPVGRMAAPGLPSQVSAAPAQFPSAAQIPAAAPVGQAVQQSALSDEALRNVGNSNFGNASRGVGRGLMRGLGRVGQFVENNAMATGMGLQALSGILGSQSERRLREREQAEERRRAQNLAMFAAPLYQNIGGQR